ncbi:MAG TPA: biotin--[acetyl-CoA-carboxylase] ligase, partial [Candidatus Omnitrophota bacterium]|nr:biotin--[acetyl-CoA-carboxylase] ligase [Candidatus Omnitrophota bacterium]
VSVAKAVRDVTGLPATIKWPNDILVHGKKVCGILTEMKAEQDMVDFIILGMGINVNTSLRHLPKGGSSLREELRNEGSDPHISRIELVKRVLEELERDYFLLQSAGSRPIIEEWKHLSDMLGGRVRVSLQSRSFEGLAHDIDPDGALVIRLDSGILQKVSSGDVIMLR